MKSVKRGRSSPSLEEDLFLNKVREYTHTIDFRQRIPFYDRSLSLSIAEHKLIESLLSLSYRGSEEKAYNYVDWAKKDFLSAPQHKQKILVINCSEFPSVGPESISRFVAKAHELGWKKFMTFGWRGQISCGCGLGSHSDDVRIDVYGIPGDDLASGLDGAEIIVHGNAGNRVGQEMKSGKLVIYGDVGRNFMQKAMGGEVYVLGNISGGPFTYSSGSSRVVINGTCFYQSKEPSQTTISSKHSGFVILNRLMFNGKGEIEDLETPYSEESLFSLLPGQTVFIRDPQTKMKNAQLIGVRIHELTETDCLNIFLCLRENQKLFNIDILDLITVKNQLMPFHEVYHKFESTEPQVLM